MLINLQIKDFLLIDELELDFEAGLTVITGETGSGKSITIDALLLIFGAKGNSDIIRVGQKQASFSATFNVDNPAILAWLSEREFVDSSEENTIICRRVIDVNGRSKAFINSIPVNLGVLKELGESLLDIHTQHASIALLRSENQRLLLDEFAGISDEVRLLSESFRRIANLESKLNAAHEFSQDLQIKQQILAEKIADLIDLALGADEWDSLQVQQKQLANASFILQELDFALNLLNGEQGSLGDLITLLGSRLNKISEFLPNGEQVQQLHASLEAESNELERELQYIASKIEQDPELLAEVDRRIDAVYSLARKYRVSPDDLPECLPRWQEEFNLLAHDADLAALQGELDLAREDYLQYAQKISRAREQAAASLSQTVSGMLGKLAINGEFYIELLPSSSWLASGLESIQYLVSFNQGLPLQPLNKVASGGELSRVALALYVTLSINNPPEVIVFDEIDVGIGGGVAEVVGTLLHELGCAKQVICITHQPQTACCGDRHLRVSKQLQMGVSQTQISYIEGQERIAEIARMLGGLQITATTLQHAEELLAPKSKNLR